MEELRELLIEELRDLYHAEGQLTKALPRMAKAARSPELKQAITKHLEETEGQVERLQQVFEQLGVKTRGKPCKGMAGIVEEGKESIAEGKKKNPLIADLELIGAAQRVEHYEMAGYGTARTMAEQLGEQEVANLLEQTLKEEEATDKALTELALPLYEQIKSESGDDEEDEDDEEGDQEEGDEEEE